MPIVETTEYQIEAPRDEVCPKCGARIMWANCSYSMKWLPIDPSGGPHRCPKLYAAARDFPKLEE